MRHTSHDRHRQHSRSRCRLRIHAQLLLTCALLLGIAPITAAEEVPTITVPLPPPGVYRDPDWKRDFPGYRAIANGWLSDDGKTFWCIADRGEPISFQSIHEGKAKHDPVFLELDLVTRTIVREVDLPDDGPWVTGQHIMYLPKMDRLLGWKMTISWSRQQTNKDRTRFGIPNGWELHTLDLHPPKEPVTQTYPYAAQPRGTSDWEWFFSADEKWVWRLVYRSDGHCLSLEKMSTATLESVREFDLDWSPQTEGAPSSPFRYLDWRIDEAADELWIGVVIGEDETGELHWLRFNLSDGSLVGRTVVSDEVSLRRGVYFLGDGAYLAARMPMPEDDYRLGTQRLWRLPTCELAFEVPRSRAGAPGIRPLRGDGRYLFVRGNNSSHVPGSLKPIDELVVWRYDRERDAWSWPRRMVLKGPAGHDLYADDGQTMVAFNEVDGRPNRLAVYRFGDEEQYDAELAEALSKQQAQLAAVDVEPFPEAEHTVEVSPDGDEVAVDRRALPVPAGQVLKAAASADGKRVALWMRREDHRPTGREWMREPIDPSIGYYVAVVIDAESGNVIREVAHPSGYMQDELNRHSQVFLSPDGRWLVTYVAHDNKLMPRMEWPVPGEAQMSVIDVETGEALAERSFSDGGSWWLRQVDHGRRLVLRTSSMGRPTVSTFEFCKLPSLETEAKLQWTWPDHKYGDDEQRAIADNVMYDPDQGRFVALMREAGERHGGRQIPAAQWVQYFDAETMRPIKRGPVFYAQHGAGFPRPGDGLFMLNYEHDGRNDTVDIYRFESDRPILRIDGSAYQDGMSGRFVGGGPWLTLNPGTRRNGKPGISLVNAETREVLGPLPIEYKRSILWISPDGRRILLQHDLMFTAYPKRDTASPLEWLTVREPN